MTPDDYQNMNDLLIAQSGENEILIEGMTEEIRDLKAQLQTRDEKIKNLEDHIDDLEDTINRLEDII